MLEQHTPAAVINKLIPSKHMLPFSVFNLSRNFHIRVRKQNNGVRSR